MTDEEKKMENSKKIVLVVDDNKELVSILRACLEHHGYHVLMAYNGEAAIRTIRSSKPDLVVLDIGMPKKGGFEVCREMTTQYGHSKVPVLIITGHNELRDTFKDLEVEGFLSKPFELEEMMKEVERILEASAKPKVFLIDPNGNSHAEKIKRALERECYKTVFVEDLNNFKQLAVTHKPEFVIVEYIREDMTGSDFILSLKQAMIEQWNEAVPVVVYSYSGLDYSEKSLSAGADRYLDHPEDYMTFVRTLREFEIEKHLKDKESHRKAA
ncbi:MAG: response regulator [Candidatus Omnitrophica bacterium]|nr:response regulator [Candidatus Omnitrophota bacterium]